MTGHFLLAVTLLLFVESPPGTAGKPVTVLLEPLVTGYRLSEGDMTAVGSLHREVRQQRSLEPQPIATEVADLLAADHASKSGKHRPKNSSGKSNEGGFYKTFGSDANGEKGYLKKSYSKGDHGYKTLDTFHKKLGDRYGFEEHEAFGKGSEGGQETGQHESKSATSKRKKNNGDHEGAGTDGVSTYADEYAGYSGEYYGGDGSDDSSSSSSSYSDGSGESYASSGEAEGGGSGESYASSGEDGSYYSD